MAAVHHSSAYKRAAKAYKDSFGGYAVCWLCSTPIDFSAHHNSPSAFTTDHSIAVATEMADPLDVSLWRPAHKKCNSSRKDKPDHLRTKPYIPPGRTEPVVNDGATVLSETRTSETRTSSSSTIRVSTAASGCQGLDPTCTTCTAPKPRKLPCQSSWTRVSFDPISGEITSADRTAEPETPAAPEAPQPVEDVPAAGVVHMTRPASLKLL